MKPFDFGFGNSVCVRQAFLEWYNGNMVVFSWDGLKKFDYPERTGDLELVELTKEVIERQTGEKYKHVFITNGATGGVVISLRAYKQLKCTKVHTRPAPWYLRYPSMIRASGLEHDSKTDNLSRIRSVILLDLPSNPLGLVDEIDSGYDIPTILDGVYFNNVYMNGVFKAPRHDVMVGSYSKLLGLNGLRVGWIATNNDAMVDIFKDLVTGEYCGISVASTEIIKQTLFDFNWDLFEMNARAKLDWNREKIAKLEKFFGNAPVPSRGMFYYAPMDQKCKELLEKSRVTWTTGSSLGTTDDFCRINLAQDNALTSLMVNTVLHNDYSRVPKP